MDRNKFGARLRYFRRRARDPLRGGAITQERLSHVLYEISQLDYSHVAISDWERGKSQISKDARDILVGLITTLGKYHGIVTREEADDWLAIGNYRALNSEELRIIHQAGVDWPESEQVPPPLQASTQTDSAIALPPHHIPLPSTPFIGREAEIEAINSLLQQPQTRLVTIVGSGGMGKTRLALEVARQQLQVNNNNKPHFPDGIFFIFLGSVDKQNGLLPTIARPLELQLQVDEDEHRQPSQQLFDYIRQKQLLLILDNFEDVLESTPLLEQIIQSTTTVSLLVTCREPLYLQQEQLFPLGGLIPSSTQPSANPLHPGIELFIQSAQRVKPYYQPTTEDRLAIDTICRLVDGMPLGIELAASWITVMTVTDIANEIQHSLDMLTSRLRNVPDRHRSLRAVIDSSWQRLTPKEQEIFRQLSVFKGGFSRQAAKKISNASLSALVTLSEKSMLSFRHEYNRYETHALLRYYGQEQLAQNPWQEENVRDRHSEYYLEALHQRTSAFYGSEQLATLVEIDHDLENVKAAWEWATENKRVARLSKAMTCLGNYFWQRGRYQEGQVSFNNVISHLRSFNMTNQAKVERDRSLANALVWQARFDIVLGKESQVQQLLRESLTLSESLLANYHDARPEKAFALHVLGQLSGEIGLLQAKEHHQESLNLYRSLNHVWGQAQALYAAGQTALALGDHPSANKYLRESATLFKTLDNKIGVARTQVGLGKLAYLEGQIESCRELIEASLAIYRLLDDQAGIALCLERLSETHLMRGEYLAGHNCVEECVQILSTLGNQRKIAFLTTWIGSINDLNLGYYEQVRSRMYKNLAFYRELNDQSGIATVYRILGNVALGEQNYKEAESTLRQSIEGHELIGQEDEAARAMALLSYAVRKLNHTGEAQRLLYTVLKSSVDNRFYNPLILTLPGIALLLVDLGELALAIQVYAAASTQPVMSRKSIWFKDVAGREMAQAEQLIPLEKREKLKTQGESIGFWKIADKLINALPELDWQII